MINSIDLSFIKINANFGNIELKLFESSDFSYLEDIYMDYLLNSMLVSETPMNPEYMLEKIKCFTEIDNSLGLRYWKILNNGNFLGFFGITKMHNMEEFEISYALKREYRNKGICSALCEHLISIAFENIGLKRIYGRSLSYNNISQHILRKIGMVNDGIQICDTNYKKDSYLTKFILTKEEYERIKEYNDGIYRVKKITNNLNINELHPNARHLDVAIIDFRDNNHSIKYQHSLALSKYMLQKYPRLLKSGVR